MAFHFILIHLCLKGIFLKVCKCSSAFIILGIVIYYNAIKRITLFINLMIWFMWLNDNRLATA